MTPLSQQTTAELRKSILVFLYERGLIVLTESAQIVRRVRRCGMPEDEVSEEHIRQALAYDVATGYIATEADALHKGLLRYRITSRGIDIVESEGLV